jgi:hypothetical protein
MPFNPPGVREIEPVTLLRLNNGANNGIPSGTIDGVTVANNGVHIDGHVALELNYSQIKVEYYVQNVSGQIRTVRLVGTSTATPSRDGSGTVLFSFDAVTADNTPRACAVTVTGLRNGSPPGDTSEFSDFVQATTPTATPMGTPTVTSTPTPTPTPCAGRCTPTPRPRPTPAPRPTPR